LLKKGIVKPMLAFDTVEAVQQELGSAGYIASDGLAVSLFLALAKQRALFLEGEAGVGKTEIAKMLSHVLDRDLIRLQCYEGWILIRLPMSGIMLASLLKFRRSDNLPQMRNRMPITCFVKIS
jgi:hypothetical protein